MGRSDHRRVAADRGAPASTLTRANHHCDPGRRNPRGLWNPPLPGPAARPLSYPDAKIAATNGPSRHSAPAINPDERSGLGITKGDLLLMTRLGVFVEGPHDVIILSEWFGDELRESGIRIFPAHGADNFEEITTAKPGLVGSEIIGALGIRIAVISDKRTAGGEPTTKRIVREGRQEGYNITDMDLSEEDILFYLDEQVCREFPADFPGWRAARDAARRAERRNRDARKWKRWISDTYGLELSRGGIRRIAAECKRKSRVAPELRHIIGQLIALATTSPAEGPDSREALGHACDLGQQISARSR